MEAGRWGMEEKCDKFAGDKALHDIGDYMGTEF
jgi:hypothetical protein